MMGRAILIDRFLSDSDITSATEEYGLFTKQPYPDAYNVGSVQAGAGGVPTAAEDVIAKIFTLGDIETSKFLWCEQEDESAGNNWFGRNPIFHSIWEKIADNSGGTDYYEYDVIYAANRNIYLAVEEDVSGDHDLEFYRISRTDHTSLTHISTIDASPASGTKVLMCEAQDRELIFVVYEHSGGDFKVKMTSNYGLSWGEIYSGSDFSAPHSLRCSNGVLYLTYSPGANLIRVMYSLDLGGSWSTLETLSARHDSDSELIVLDSGNFGLLAQENVTHKLQFQEAIPGSTFGTAVDINTYAGELEGITAENILGTILIIAYDSANWCDYFISTDDGATWSAIQDYHYVTAGGLFSSIDNFKLREIENQPVFLTNGLSTTLGIIFLWGYRWANVNESYDYQEHWDSVDEPDEAIFGWSRTSTGGTDAIQGDLTLKINTTWNDPIAEQLYYTRATGAGSADGVTIRSCLKVTAGATGDNWAGIDARVNYSAAPNVGYEAQLRVYTDHLDLFDVTGASALATVTHNFTTYHEFLIAIKSSSVSLWYRAEGSIEWTSVLQGGTLVDGGIASTQFIWGHYIGSNTDQESSWKYFYWKNNDNGLADGFTNPTDLIQMETKGELQHLINGVEVEFSGQDAAVGDKWEIQTGYKYPKEAIITDSPGEYWRSVQDGIACYINLDATTNSVYAVNAAALFNINFKTAYIEMDNVSTFDSAALQTITISSELDSGTFTAVDDDFAQDSTKDWTPRGHRNHYLRGYDGTTYHTHIIDDNEPDTLYCRGDELVTTDGLTVSDAYAIFQSCAGGTFTAVKRFRHMRIHIPAQVTDEGYYRIGKFVPGIFYPFTKDIDWGFSEVESGNVSILESRGRQRYPTKRGEPRKTLAVSWAAQASTIVEELRGLIRYGDFSLKPAVFFRDLSDMTDVMLCRLVGEYRLQNIVSALQDAGNYEEWYNIEILTLEEEL